MKYGKLVGAAICHLFTIVTPCTFQRSLRQEAGTPKATPFAAPSGRPQIDKDIRDLVLRLARETGWGYTRIFGELKKLAVNSISRSTVGNILAEQLQKERFPTIRPDKPWTKVTANNLLARRFLKPGRAENVELADDEWLLSDLVRELGIRPHQFRSWIHQGYLHCRRSALRRYYIVWADTQERDRLRRLQAYAQAHLAMRPSEYPNDLKTPKERTAPRKEKSAVPN